MMSLLIYAVVLSVALRRDSYIRAMELEFVGNNVPGMYPLGACQGDCDWYRHCFGELRCRKRSATQAIPGCNGTGVSGMDYCYNPKQVGTLIYLGNDGKPTVSFPLGECEGDCDADDDCAGNLKCFQQNGSVPECVGKGVDGVSYCYNDGPPTLRMYRDFDTPETFPLAECSGDCNNDSECFGNLLCFQRNAEEAVPGCTGPGVFANDYCYKPNGNGNLAYVGDDGIPARSFPLGECEGDCDSDEDCEGDLVCLERTGTEPVPGCDGTDTLSTDYCYDLSRVSPPTNSPTNSPTNAPTNAPTNPVFDPRSSLQIDGDNDTPEAFPLAECSGDCDSNSECFGDLRCFERNGVQPVPGCTGAGVSAKDYCYNPINDGSLAYVGDNGLPARSFPLRECEGDCDSDSDCEGTLLCFQRDDIEDVPGCLGRENNSGKDYCYDISRVSPPTPSPTLGPPGEPRATTYYPGDLTETRFDKYGRAVTLSTGMDGRAIAYTGEMVKFTDGSNGESSIPFHDAPDAAGVFPATDGGFYYATNSEVPSANGGGVYVIAFTANGEVKDYFKTLSSNINCGGGKTPWGTWVTCEENGNVGRVYQTDPSGVRVSEMTDVVEIGGNYESFAYDVRNPNIPRFFTTEDSANGALVRFTPSAAGVACFNSADKWCTLHNGGIHDYLRVDVGNSGSFSWGSRAQATPSLYPNAEGIDVVNGILYFVSKVDKTLFALDLDNGSFTRTSTVSGAFNLQPDQLRALVSDPNEIIYFCEDGGDDCDLHGRDTSNGRFFTILEGTDYRTETTGLGFSPDARFIFLSFQRPGVIWQFWRQDGLPFTGGVVDIKYHAITSRRYRKN